MLQIKLACKLPPLNFSVFSCITAPCFKCTVVVAGDRTLINIMATLLERYGKSENQSGAPSDVTSLFPGLPCVAQFAEDGMWYRASVIKVVEDKVEVIKDLQIVCYYKLLGRRVLHYIREVLHRVPKNDSVLGCISSG